ncbi:MAG TPA: hypothetical protein VL442_18270 [Mucilaginibacter sp.]|nr:hypothetical protein [Mucilaginibacter sp.]
MIKPGKIKKEYLLLTASLLMLVICYQLAFKKTIEAWHVHKKLTSKLTQSSSVNFQPGYSERKNANISRILNLYKADTISFRSNTISRISSIAEKENVKLSNVPVEDPMLHNNQHIIQKLAFEGDYFALIKTLNELQNTPGIGMIRSIDIKSARNLFNESSSKKLTLTIQLVSHS